MTLLVCKLQLDLSKVKSTTEKIVAALDAEQTDNLPNLLGEFGH